jgi:hypothetical protein
MDDEAMADDGAPGLDRDGLCELLERQQGVVSRRQLRELGATPWDVRRLLRRRELTVVHPGVYVNHTGTLSSAQRRWAAVLAHWPAALTRQSVLPGHEDDAVVHVAVARGRTVQAVPGVRVHRTTRLHDRVLWNLGPPALRLEDAVIEAVLAEPDVDAQFELLAAPCRDRRTTPQRLADEVRARARVAHRALLLELIADLGQGACSVLEREFLRLETTHGLPAGTRQAPATVGGRRTYQDVRYADHGVVVELDGRVVHGDADTWNADHARDLAASVRTDDLTVRLTYRQVFRDGCRTIADVARLLQRRGWDGEVQRCPHCPADRAAA